MGWPNHSSMRDGQFCVSLKARGDLFPEVPTNSGSIWILYTIHVFWPKCPYLSFLKIDFMMAPRYPRVQVEVRALKHKTTFWW